MPRQLTPPEYAVFQQDTNYLGADIQVYGSRVAKWSQNNNMVVLIYHTANYGYVLTDITDLGPATIAELAKQSEIHDVWYYLPESIQEVISERAENVVTAGRTVEEVVKEIAQTTGITLQNLISPLVEALTVPLIIIGVILGIYLIKKG